MLNSCYSLAENPNGLGRFGWGLLSGGVLDGDGGNGLRGGGVLDGEGNTVCERRRRWGFVEGWLEEGWGGSLRMF